MNQSTLPNHPLAFTLPQLAEMVNRQIKQAGSQRSSIWDEGRVELLWDSILRGYPIGSLLFGLAHENDLPEVGVRDLQVARSNPSQETYHPDEEVEYIVIDGQQRLDAITLAWSDADPGARLWLDLAEPAVPDQCRFEFHLCSRLHPWGAGASPESRRRALELIGRSEFDLPGPEPAETWPLRAGLPVPFTALIALLQALPPQAAPAVEAVLALVPGQVNAAARKLRGDWQEVLAAISQTLIHGAYRVPVVLAAGLDKRKLGQIFERLNTQGVAPNQADLFYSALKLRWPAANNRIGRLAGDVAIGSLMPPLDLVHLAVRTVAPEVTELKTERFDRLVEKRLPALQELLNPAAQGPTVDQIPLQQALHRARQVLEYTGQPGDPGLPAPLLAQIKGRIWQPLVYWLSQHPGPLPAQDRLEMLRFSLFCLLYTHPASKSSSLWMAPYGPQDEQGRWELAGAQNFPGRKIYRRFQHLATLEGNVLEILTPEAYRARLETQTDLPNDFELYNERAILMWAQRQFLGLWFGRFGEQPYWRMAHRPFELDHLLPASFLTFSGPIPIAHFCHPQIEARYPRQRVLQMSGNLRYWPAALCRDLQDLNLDKKLLLGPPGTPTPPEFHPYELYTLGQVRQASLLAEEDLPAWEAAAYIGRWTKDWKDLARFRTFRQAVETRRLRLYTDLYQALDFAAW